MIPLRLLPEGYGTKQKRRFPSRVSYAYSGFGEIGGIYSSARGMSVITLPLQSVCITREVCGLHVDIAVTGGGHQ
jgi:hypothetical protein